MSGRPPFTPLDFQLVLLRRMADHNPDLVAGARRALGVSLADMREANKRWQAMVRSPRGRTAAGRYRSVLGTPESRAPRRIGDLECEAWQWPIPLWPDLRFEVLAGPGGAVWNEWLVRAPGAPAPTLRTLADLTPWSCTIDEAAHAFAPARPLQGTAPTRWGLVLTGPDGEEAVAEFTWGLFQRVLSDGP
ncbi:hypothetical protein ACFWHW_10660 [Streptomyces pharetrae]|uniref:hypothetical protein n=1 Tax=Streptomyces pharetrae TaxID=291370 RepID=UPI003667D0BE